MLTTTYRLNDVLADWPSRTFYEGKIQPSAEAAVRRLKLHQPEARWQAFLDPQQPLVFLDLGHRNNKQRSRSEAELACDLVLALLRARVPPWEIGVVVPYRAQGRLVRNLLRDQVERETLKELAVDTVERMQGQEREVVLVSLTTSSPAYAEQLAQFFFQPERLNVSITRPRSKLILLGSSYVLQAEPEDPEQQAWVEMLGDLLQHCTTYHL
jgi:DNA replication ATP-dependent helicase Dna2